MEGEREKIERDAPFMVTSCGLCFLITIARASCRSVGRCMVTRDGSPFRKAGVLGGNKQRRESRSTRWSDYKEKRTEKIEIQMVNG